MDWKTYAATTRSSRKQYVKYMERIQPQGDLLYNRIAPIYSRAGASPTTTRWTTRCSTCWASRYVVTTQTIPNAGYRLAYDGEVKVYENLDAFPRVFIVPEAIAAADQRRRWICYRW